MLTKNCDWAEAAERLFSLRTASIGVASCKSLRFRHPGVLPAEVQEHQSLDSGPKTLSEWRLRDFRKRLIVLFVKCHNDPC